MRCVLLVGALCVASCDIKDAPNPPPPPPPSVFNSGDAVEALLRDRVRTRFPGTDDFQVYVTEVGYPIGTIMPEGRTIGIDKDVCKPATPAGAYSLPNIFPSINMTANAAFELGLDSAAVAQLASFGVKTGKNDVFKLSVADAKGQFLLENELRNLLAQPACSAFLRGKTLMLVRGYVAGKRDFQLQRDVARGGNIGLTKIGTLKVDSSATGGVSLKDDQDADFLQIVSKVSLPANGTTAFVESSTPLGGTGRVYVQRDIADASNNASDLKTLLAGQSFKVVPQVEAIESGKMPSIAQVRYFNKADEALADRALVLLRQKYPSAAKLFVGLRAPPGQLEVWLPRAGS